MVDNFEEDFIDKKKYLEKKLSIPIRLLGSKEVVDLFMTHLPDLG